MYIDGQGRAVTGYSVELGATDRWQ